MNQTLHFDRMTKRYGANLVLRDVSIALHPGRIHALMGENGAGKSTFIKLIAGVVPADQMEVHIGADKVAITTPQDATRAGFRFIHQELNIIPQLSVAENILLGHKTPSRLGVFVNWRELRTQAAAALAALGVDHIDPRQQAGKLGTGDRMLIKLASALVEDVSATARLYVLDEPTAALKEAEVEKLFQVLRRLRSNGAALLYVSHRMEEISALCDDVSVLRNGALIRSGPLSQTSPEQIVMDMTGKDVGQSLPPRVSPIAKSVICRLTDVSTRRLTGLNIKIHSGEILGIAGLAGARQTDLLRLFLGDQRVLLGQAQFLDQPLPTSPAAAWAKGVAYVPQERRSEGLMIRMNVRANTLLPHLTGARARKAAEQTRVQDLAQKVTLKSEGPEQSVWQLSGGNQQKVVFARALAGNPRLLLLDEPTRGVDIGARAEIYTLIRALSAKGCAVIVSSSDLPELIGLSDRILTLHSGRQTGIVSARDVTPADLLTHLYSAFESRSA